MNRLETLVVGHDGSEAAAIALTWVAERWAGCGTIHVVHSIAPARPLSVAMLGSSADQRRAEAEEALEGPWTEAARLAGATVASHLVDDDPADAILAIAEEHQADAIVVGPHSLKGNQFALGRVTRKLLQHSTRPVIVAKAHREGAADVAGPVVACIGYGEATEDAAMWAADYAVWADLDLTLLHVLGPRPIYPFDSPSDTMASYLGPEVSQDWARAELERLRHDVNERRPALPVITSLKVGFATRVIEEASLGAELVVLGRRRTGAFTRALVSPRIHRTVARSNTTVAVIPSCPTQ